MGIRKRDVHFSDWAKVRDGLIASNVTAITASSTDEEVRAFLINTTSDQNPFYYYVVYIKSTQEIYTHGQFYNCSPTDWDDIIDKPELVLKSDHDADIVQLETTKQDQLISGTNIKTVNGVSLLGSGNINTLLQIQPEDYESLVWLKNNGMLVPGQKYRIYYTPNVHYSNIASLGLPMYLILTATSTNTFDPKVTALPTPYSEFYYAYANLPAWEIWYDLADGDSAYKYQWYDRDGLSYDDIRPTPVPVLFMGNEDDPEHYDGNYRNIVLQISNSGDEIRVGSAGYVLERDGGSICFYNFSSELTNDMRHWIGANVDVWEPAAGSSTSYFVITPATHDDNYNYVDSMWSSWKLSEYDIQARGVIYKMIDPFGNEAPYDFTNIYFLSENGYAGISKWVPTFGFENEFGIGIMDATVSGCGHVTNNKIAVPANHKPSDWITKFHLPNIQLWGSRPYSSCNIMQHNECSNHFFCADNGNLQVYVDLNGNIKIWYPHELVQ